MKIDDITSLKVFKTVYETRSLTRASEVLGLSKAALSKRIDSLEENLGYKVFSRSTRAIVPTREAERLVVLVNEILEKLDGLDLSAAKKNEKTKVRVTCIASMSQKFMGKILQEFRDKNPSVSVELIVTDSVLDVIEHDIDLAIRINPSKNSGLVGKRLGSYELVAVASPGYLKNKKKIKSVSELTEHPLYFLDQHKGFFPKEMVKAAMDKRLFKTNDSPLISQLILSGKGIGVRSSWDVKDLVDAKKLSYLSSPVLAGDLWLLGEADKLKNDTVRSLYEFLLEKVSKHL